MSHYQGTKSHYEHMLVSLYCTFKVERSVCAHLCTLCTTLLTVLHTVFPCVVMCAMS